MTLRRWHDGRCGICGFADRVVTDHDHATGLIRGLLCHSCNVSEGMGLCDVATQRWRAGENTAAALGIVEVYYSPFTGYAKPVPPPPTDAELDAIAEAICQPAPDWLEAVIDERNREEQERKEAKRAAAFR